MKIITMGKKSRYALIVMLKDRITRKSIDDKITYYNSDNIKELRKLYLSMLNFHLDNGDSKTLLDCCIYDYKEGHYCNLY